MRYFVGLTVVVVLFLVTATFASEYSYWKQEIQKQLSEVSQTSQKINDVLGTAKQASENVTAVMGSVKQVIDSLHGRVTLSEAETVKLKADVDALRYTLEAQQSEMRLAQQKYDELSQRRTK